MKRFLKMFAPYCKFQYQKGAIKTYLPRQNGFETKKFQYQKGAIKTYFKYSLIYIPLHFNTKKVRLKLAGRFK